MLRGMVSRPLLACVAAAGSLACTAPPAGVHVVVTMEDADFTADHAFDHLTVIARVGDREARVCLYPADAVTRERALDDASPHACADLREQPWTGPPTAASWALAARPRTINVEAADGERVEVEVIGGFGGRLATVTGAGERPAAADYPELRVALSAGERVFAEGCELELETSLPEEFDTRYRLCEAFMVKCPEKAPSLLRSPAVYCVNEETSRLRNGPGVTCGEEQGAPTVWRTPPIPAIEGQTGCVRLFATARFARCKDGDPADPRGCEVTTDCTPAPVSGWTRAGGVNGPTLSEAAMECAPPTAVPITWSMQLRVANGDVVAGISQSVKTSAEGACFLDVESIAARSVPCDP